MMVNIMQFLSIQRRFAWFVLLYFGILYSCLFFFGWEEERRILFASQ